MPDRMIGAGWHSPGKLGAAGSGRPTAHDIATRMLAFNTARDAAFAPYGMVVNDIAWELMLRMFVAQERGVRLTVQQLCGDVATPRGVSLRWARALQANGLLDYDERAGLSAQVRLPVVAAQVLRQLLEA